MLQKMLLKFEGNGKRMALLKWKIVVARKSRGNEKADFPKKRATKNY
jgi:hypothetical protein